MGCCANRDEPTKLTPTENPTKEQDSKGKKTDAPGPPKPNSLVLHLQPKAPPHRVLKVLQVLVVPAKANIEIRETPNLETAIHPKIVRYPTAEFEGQVLAGEGVINRYVAQKASFYPVAPEDVYDCESLVEQILDMWTALEKSAGTDADADTIYAQAQLLNPIEKRLKKGRKYFVGSNPTYADVYVFAFLLEFFLSDQLKAKRGNAVPKGLQQFVDALKGSSPFNVYLKPPPKR